MKHRKLYALVLAVFFLATFVAQALPISTYAAGGASGTYNSDGSLTVNGEKFVSCDSSSINKGNTNACLLAGTIQDTQVKSDTTVDVGSESGIWWPATPHFPSTPIQCGTKGKDPVSLGIGGEHVLALNVTSGGSGTAFYLTLGPDSATTVRSGKSAIDYNTCSDAHSENDPNQYIQAGVPLSFTNKPTSGNPGTGGGLSTITGNFINASTIVLDSKSDGTPSYDAGDTFTSTDHSSHIFYLNGVAGSAPNCNDFIGPGTSGSTFYLWHADGSSTSCDTDQSDGNFRYAAEAQTSLGNQQDAKDFFEWVDNSHIVDVFTKVSYALQSTGAKEFETTCSNDSGDTITINGADDSTKNVQAKWVGDKCASPSSYGLDNSNFTVLAANKAAALSPTTPTPQGSSTDSCEANGDPLSWIACPVIEALAGAADGIYTNVVRPLLNTSPLDINNPSDVVSQDIYNAWGGFRIFGDIFLVIALLVIVFGESIGGGLIDAYTAKKVLPRLLIAAVLVNLSIYIVAVMIDITNIVGVGIIGLITEPFKNVPGSFNLTPGAGGSLGLDSLVTGGAIWAVASFGSLLEVILTVVLVPGLLIFLSIVATVLIRRALIIFLVLVSPVAFALYCLPNTEQYFKKWWDTLIKTLLVYPIIAVFFGLAQVMSATLKWGGQTGGLTTTFADILSIIALFIPLVMIPFAFRLAGGVIGRVHDLSSNVRERAHKMGENRRQRALGHLRNTQTARRDSAYQSIKTSASKGGAFRSKSLGLLARGVGGYNIEQKSAELTAQAAKEINDQIATGKEQEIRGVSVNKEWALKQEEGENGEWKKTADGKRQFKSAGGAWIDEADVDAGHRRWGNNVYAQQASLAREIDKAQTDEQIEHLATSYKEIATGPGGWGMTDNQAANAWQGATYQHQNQKLDLKHSSWKTGKLTNDKGEYTTEKQSDGTVQIKGGAGKLVDESYEKRGSYGLAQMSAHTIEAFTPIYQHAQEIGDVTTQRKIEAIAETFMHDLGGPGGGYEGAENQEERPPVDASGTVIPGRRQASTAGAGHVAEEVRKLAVLTKVGGPSGSAPANPQK